MRETKRGLHRHRCPDLAAVRRTSARCLRAYPRTPHRRLRVATHGSRFPGGAGRRPPQLRPLPPGFTLAASRDGRGALALPLARGRISFVGRVDRAGTIALPGSTSHVARRLAGQSVVATLYTHRREIIVTLEGRVVKRFPCPIRGKLVPPLYPLPRGRSCLTLRCYGGAHLAATWRAPGRKTAGLITRKRVLDKGDSPFTRNGRRRPAPVLLSRVGRAEG